jgi:hypothetical protein
MQTLPLDTKKLDFLMDTNPLAADIFEQLNKRKRYSKITDLRRLRMDIEREGGELNPEQWVSAIKGLEAANAGVSIKASGTNPPRFRWFWNLKHIARRALGDAEAEFKIKKYKEKADLARQHYINENKLKEIRQKLVTTLDLRNTTMGVTVLDKSVLKKIAKENECSQVIFGHLSSRDRFSQQTDLRALYFKIKKDLPKNATQKEFMSVFQKLADEAGTGMFIVGRNGQPNRFEWSYNLKEIGQLALGTDIDPQPLPGKQQTTQKNFFTESPRKHQPTFAETRKAIETKHIEPEIRYKQEFNTDFIKLMVAVPKNVDPVELLEYVEMGRNLKTR